MKTRFFLILLLIVCSEVCFATTIHGTVYDTALNPVKGSVIEVDSVPFQRIISKDGSYSFNLNQGNYTVIAKHNNMLAKESVLIEDENGDYVIDLFLFPTFEEEEDLLNDTSLEVGNLYGEESSIWPLLALIIVVVAIALIFLAYFRKLKKRVKDDFEKDVEPEYNSKGPDDSDKFIDFIKLEGGRVTQKGIRDKFPLSEAKISLIISELEHKGLVEKIKKGRGNIIILKK